MIPQEPEATNPEVKEGAVPETKQDLQKSRIHQQDLYLKLRLMPMGFQKLKYFFHPAVLIY